ncbi:MAG: hypothetical protein OXC30_05475 [Alphaproteobacteria bacterium]|nr:hypothetical protein [Alphaproteobacteria bacterium]
MRNAKALMRSEMAKRHCATIPDRETIILIDQSGGILWVVILIRKILAQSHSFSSRSFLLLTMMCQMQDRSYIINCLQSYAE